MGARLGRISGHGCSCAMPAVCCGPGDDAADELPIESIKCKQAISLRSDGSALGMELQVPIVTGISATTPAPQIQRHSPAAYQLSCCQTSAASLVAQPTTIHVGEELSSPQAQQRLRPQMSRHLIQLVAVPATVSPVNRSPSQQQQQQQSPTFQGRIQCSGSMCQTPCSPGNTPTGRRVNHQPSQGQPPLSRVVHAGPDQASSPCHGQGSVPSPKSDAGMGSVQHEKAPAVRRHASVEKSDPVPEASKKVEPLRLDSNKLQPLTGSIDDSNTTAPPSPTIYYGTPNVTNRHIRCDDVQLRNGGDFASKSHCHADLPNLGHENSGSVVTTGMHMNK